MWQARPVWCRCRAVRSVTSNTRTYSLLGVQAVQTYGGGVLSAELPARPGPRVAPEGSLTSMYMFPCSSEMAERGSPLRRWSPSQFWDTTCCTWGDMAALSGGPPSVRLAQCPQAGKAGRSRQDRGGPGPPCPAPTTLKHLEQPGGQMFASLPSARQGSGPGALWGHYVSVPEAPWVEEARQRVSRFPRSPPRVDTEKKHQAALQAPGHGRGKHPHQPAGRPHQALTRFCSCSRARLMCVRVGSASLRSAALPGGREAEVRPVPPLLASGQGRARLLT